MISSTKKPLLKVIKTTVFFNSYSDKRFFITNSGKQELIHHIHCCGCIFYHQIKTNKLCLFHRFLFYDLHLETYLMNVSNISYLTRDLFIPYDFLLQQYFYSHLLHFYAHYYHLPN